MKAEDLKPNKILLGPIFPEPVQIIVCIPMGDAVKLVAKGLRLGQGTLPRPATRASTSQNVIVPPARVRYLAEIAEIVRKYHGWTGDQARKAFGIGKNSSAPAYLRRCSWRKRTMTPFA